MPAKTPPLHADDTSWDARVPVRPTLKLTFIGLGLLALSFALQYPETGDWFGSADMSLAIIAARGVLILSANTLMLFGLVRSWIPRRVRSTGKVFAGAPELSEQVRDVIHRYLHALSRNNDSQLGSFHLGIAAFVTSQERLARVQQRFAGNPSSRSQRLYERARADAAEAHESTLKQLTRFEASAIVGEKARLVLVERNGG